MTAKKHSPRFLSLCNKALTQINEVDPKVVKTRLEAREAFHFIDVREDHEWVHGHVPAATHIGRGILERDIEALIPDAKAEIILYCGGGYRSALAALALQEMGYTNVRSMARGFRGWCDLGFATTSAETQT